MQKAKVFWSGRSQAVRLPKEFRVEADELAIRREGDALILEPIAKGWDWLKKMPGHVDEDFEKAANEDVLEQERPQLDQIFK